MIPGSTVILDQIKLAIRETWNKDYREFFGPNPEKVSLATSMLDEPPSHAGAVSSNSLSRIKQRVNELEEQNEQLFSCLFYLIEKLPELVIRTIQDESGNPASRKVAGERVSDRNGGPTRREMDVLELLSKGYCAKEIAAKLYISETTVITHKKNLKKKFNARNTAELISKMKKEQGVFK